MILVRSTIVCFCGHDRSSKERDERALTWPLPEGEGAGAASLAAVCHNACVIRSVFSNPRWPALERRLIVAGVLLVGAVTLLALGALALARAAPAWWASAAVAPGPERSAAAEAVERGVSAALYGHAADRALWTVELKQADANAWLAERLGRWAENRGIELPVRAGEVRARFGDGVIAVGIEREGAAIGRVVSVELSPRVDGDGALMIDGARVAAGRLPIPGALMPGRHDARGGSVLGELLAGRGVSRAAAVVLDDGRRVVIRSISVSPGAVRVTCATEPAARSDAKVSP